MSNHRFICLVITILAGTVLILACGASPMEAYGLFFRGIFGTPAGFAEIFVKACPLILTGLGCAVAYRTGFFNIGAEGQVLIGGVTSAAMMIYLGNSLPPVVLFPLMFLGSAAAAMIWGVIPAFFKAYWNTNETLFTLMMNYVATQVNHEVGNQLGGNIVHHLLYYLLGKSKGFQLSRNH